jgi:outer membrane protein assembly factor BamB
MKKQVSIPFVFFLVFLAIVLKVEITPAGPRAVEEPKAEILEKKSVKLALKDTAFPAPLVNELRIPDDRHSYDTHGLMGGPSILVADGRIFYQDGQSGPLRVFDAQTLKALWSWPEPREYPAYYLCNVIRTFPVIFGPDPNDHLYEWTIRLGTVYNNAVIINAENPRCGISCSYALDVTDGKTIWKSSILGKDFPGKCVIIGDLIIPILGNLTAYSVTADQIKWEIKYDYEQRKIVRQSIDKTSAENQPKAHPLFWGVDDKIYSVNADTGCILWMEVPKPGLRLGFGYSDGDDGFGYKLAEPVDNIICFYHKMRRRPSVLLGFDVKKRAVLWEYQDDSYLSFVHDNGDVVVARPGPIGKRGIVCLDAKSGKEKWQCALSYSRITRPIVSDKIIYCCDKALLKKQKGSYVWQGNIYAIDHETGKIIWKYTIQGIPGEPILYKDKVYVLSTKHEEDHNGIVRIFVHKVPAEEYINGKDRESLAFQNCDDLQKVKGIGPKTVENIREWLKFE